MNQQEAAALLSVAAAFDNRKPDPDAATAWALALDGLRFTDCRDAIVAHYKATSEWLMPAMVIARVRTVRDARVKAHGVIATPPDLDPDDTQTYMRWFAIAHEAVANGDPLPEVPKLAAVPMPKELASQMATFGELPADVKRAATDHRTTTAREGQTRTNEGASK